MRVGLMFALPLFALLMGCGGCAESPSDGFEAFYRAVVDQHPDAALARLTPAARAGLEAGATAMHMQLADALVATTVHSTVRSLTEVERAGDLATLEVTDALGKKERVHMRLMDGTWRVDVQ